jgi:CubicO group peptidase (beta-lactamase class C family)
VQEVDNLAHMVINGFGVAGLAIGVVKGEQVYARGFGAKNIETQEPVTASSLFHLASISKTFVATAVVQLAEQGKLELDAPLTDYLPDFALADERYQQITVRQLLNHTAGMPDTDDYGWDRPEYDDQSLERYVRSLANENLIAAPGERFAYSNIGYEVLGLLIARASGMTFEDYIKHHLLRPLGMNSSTFLKTEVPPEHATAPHILLPPTVVSPEYPYNRAHAPSSTLHSSAEELSFWAMMNLNRGAFRDQCVLQPTSFEQLWHPYQPTGPKYPDEFVGLSWFMDTYRGRRRIRHDGVDTGFQSDLILLPDQAIAIIALANTIPAPMQMLMNAMVDVLLGLEPELPRPLALLSLSPILSMEGVQAAVDWYRHLQETQADQYDFGVEQFLDVGYTLLEVRRYDECFQMAQIALKLFPDSPDAADLLTQLDSRVGKA